MVGRMKVNIKLGRCWLAGLNGCSHLMNGRWTDG